MKTRSFILSFFFFFAICASLSAQSNDAALMAELPSEEITRVNVKPEVIPSYLLDRLPIRRPAKRQAGSWFTPEFTYPELAREYGIEGRVTVRCLISTAGTVLQATVVKGIGYGCDEAAVKAMLESQWTPAIKDGQVVATTCYVPVDFSLQ
jgi:TonB family protein